MIKIFFSLVLICISYTVEAQSSLDGAWLGTLDAGVKLRIVFHLNNNNGAFTATMDSPDQGAKNIPVSSVVLNGDSVVLKVAVANGEYSGSRINDSTINGNWRQGGMSFPLVLSKTSAEIARPKRPQTPQPPFPYIVEEVSYAGKDLAVHLAGSLTLPKEGSHLPAIILITGSGQQDRDETIFSHKPFAVIADYLTRRGYAVLRLDDRGIGSSTGPIVNLTSLDFAEDVSAGIDYLKRRPEIDSARIGLMGHSEGGFIASYLSATRKDINFIILLASPGVNGLELMVEQNGAVLKTQGLSDSAIKAYLSLYRSLAEAVVRMPDTTSATAKGLQVYRDWEGRTSFEVIKKLDLQSQGTSEQMVAAFVKGFSSPWMKYFLNSDASIYLRKTKAKVLALNGDKDIQVVASQNIPAIEAALKNGSKASTVKILPGLNHLFQTCRECTIQEYAELEETFSPAALSEISNWLQKNVPAK